MCVDFSIHDKHDGNPHCHIMLTMRALDENGKWLPKSHQEFELDERGERIRLPNGTVEVNRRIRATNRIIREIRNRINGLKEWLSELSGKLEQFAEEARSPLLGNLLLQYMEQESQRVQKYSKHFQFQHTVEIDNDMMETIRKLNVRDIYTLADLQTVLVGLREKVDAAQGIVKGKERRMRELQKLIENGRQYLRADPICKKRNGIRFKKKREDFEECHHADLALWQAANKFLHAKEVDVSTLPDSIKAWQAELATLTAEHDAEYEKLKQYRKEVKELDSVYQQAENAIKTERQAQEKQKTNTAER